MAKRKKESILDIVEDLAKERKKTKKTETKSSKRESARKTSAVVATAVGAVATKTHGKKGLITVLIFFVLGAIVGGFVCNYFFGADTFELNVNDTYGATVFIEVDSAYEELGVTVISLGKDISSEVVTTYTFEGEECSGVDTSRVGVYIITYRIIDDFKYGGYTLSRTVTILEEAEEMPNEDLGQE